MEQWRRNELFKFMKNMCLLYSKIRYGMKWKNPFKPSEGNDLASRFSHQRNLMPFFEPACFWNRHFLLSSADSRPRRIPLASLHKLSTRIQSWSSLSTFHELPWEWVFIWDLLSEETSLVWSLQEGSWGALCWWWGFWWHWSWSWSCWDCSRQIWDQWEWGPEGWSCLA